MTLQNQTNANARSIDPAEVEKFNRLASTWWDPAGPMWPLHTLNRLRTGYIVDQLCQHFDRDHNTQTPLIGLRILDIGCGAGLLSEAMARAGASVNGVDISHANIAAAKIHARDLNTSVQYEYGTADQLASGQTRFDVVLNMEVVEHVADLSVFMHACNRLVCPGGVQFVATINRNPLAWIVAVFGAEYVLRWLPKGTHQWHRLVKPRELTAALQSGNLIPVKSTGVAVNPFTRQMKLVKSEWVNYMIMAQKPR